MDGLKTSSTYALYKARQNKFTNWLKHTADSCSNVSKSGKKSKPKSKHSSILPNSTVQISEFQGLASIVVNNFSTEEIPLAMVQTLRDVIHQRRQSAQFFHRLSEDAGRADEDLLRKNDGHVHIIKVLENVLKVFEDKLRARARELKEAEVWRGKSQLFAKAGLFSVFMREYFTLVNTSPPCSNPKFLINFYSDINGVKVGFAGMAGCEIPIHHSITNFSCIHDIIMLMASS
jgi:hypothetical protein